MTRKNLYRILIFLAIVATLVASTYAIINGRRYFSNRNLRQIGTELKVFGVWTPLVIFLLILASALIPPLPIPTSFLEISSGIIFGFWPGVILVWLSQIISAIACFLLSQKIGKIFIDKISKFSAFNFFKQFIEKQGALAIFVLRATMTSPFNVSYFAGLMQMKINEFFVATAVGAIPETVLFVYLGTLISERVRFRLWYVFLGLLILNYLPTLIALIISSLKKHQTTNSINAKN